MVEFKRLLAQDAGVSGQILEESDLTDVAITERLHTDLRARALATRLLQRYGYLVPRVNPESDLAAEEKLVRQERAQILARAAEHRDTVDDNSNAVRTAGCDQRMPECAPQGALPEDRARDDRESLPSSPDASAPTQRFPEPSRADESSPGQLTPDSADFFPDQRSLDSAGLSPPEGMLAATRVDMTLSPERDPKHERLRKRGALPSISRPIRVATSVAAARSEIERARAVAHHAPPRGISGRSQRIRSRCIRTRCEFCRCGRGRAGKDGSSPESLRRRAVLV